jgi:hypothetical protein
VSPALLRRVQLSLLAVAALVTVLCGILVLAAWRNDREIDRHLATTTAEVLSAGSRRSTISFYTPDGVNHNPPLGVLYPSRLTVGDRIQVQYSTENPQLVRVAGRSAAVAVVPAGSVAVGTWVVTAALMVGLALGSRRRMSSPEVPRAAS